MRTMMLMALLWTGAAQAQTAPAVPVPPLPDGYLGGRQVLDLALVPAPPAPGSSADASDRETYGLSISEVGGPRWNAAIAQLYLSKPAGMAAQIACAVAAPVDPGNAPVLFAMLGRLVSDAVPTVDALKVKYKRARPFVGVAGFKACDPRVNAADVKSYSYPSGHGTIGTLWGDTLAAAAPDRKREAEAWGESIGDNRLACRVHWASDVATGQELGDRLFAF
ncbi:MAG: phosphatase PAP2 family protein, partial [Polymorphobacter sp.]